MQQNEKLRVLKLVDHDYQFMFNEQQSGINPIVLNRHDLSNPLYIEQLSALIFSDGAGADFMARCQCGETEGNNKIGMTCPICHTTVTANNLLDDNNLACKNWLAAPSDLPGGWLSPKLYLNLANWLSYDKGRSNYIDDILNVDAQLPFELTEIVHGQGFQYFYDNFDRLMNYFIFDHPVISKKPDTTAMRLCLEIYRKQVFCHYIPIMNAAINPIVAGSSGSSKQRYSDVTADYVLQAAISLSSLEFGSRKKNWQLHVERTAFKAFKDIIAYVEEATKKYISKKKAIPRTHIFGSRFHWSFRAVIIPIVGPHDYYELHVPWKMAVHTLRVQIQGILCREYGMNVRDAIKKTRHALQSIDPDIKRIMDRMIDESPFPGLPCLWDRPPSIRDGSVMLKYWTKIKPDLNDACIGITPTDVSVQNADFDGDRILRCF